MPGEWHTPIAACSAQMIADRVTRRALSFRRDGAKAVNGESPDGRWRSLLSAAVGVSRIPGMAKRGVKCARQPTEEQKNNEIKDTQIFASYESICTFD